jgi:hypothetical protein
MDYDDSEKDGWRFYRPDDDDDIPDGWVLVGRVNDEMSANYARETLKSYDIPAVIFSESGFFGTAGLNLPSPAGKNLGQFQIHVPAEKKEEAEDILNMILGNKWKKG